MNMRAKMEVKHVEQAYEGAEKITMEPVCGKTPFGPNGESDDNSYARWTPSGKLELIITNPNLIGTFTYGQKFYVDFTKCE